MNFKHGGGQHFLLAPLTNLLPPRTCKMTVPLVHLQMQLAILCFWSWRGVEGKEIGKGQRRMFIKTNNGPHWVFRGCSLRLVSAFSHYTPQPRSHFNRCLKRDKSTKHNEARTMFLRLYKSLVRPHLEYCSSVWSVTILLKGQTKRKNTALICKDGTKS